MNSVVWALNMDSGCFLLNRLEHPYWHFPESSTLLPSGLFIHIQLGKDRIYNSLPNDQAFYSGRIGAQDRAAG